MFYRYIQLLTHLYGVCIYGIMYYNMYRYLLYSDDFIVKMLYLNSFNLRSPCDKPTLC